MNNLYSQSYTLSTAPEEQRIADRFQHACLLAHTGQGVAKVLSISRYGISFGCLYPHIFREQIDMDIFDAKNTFIRKLRIQKLWENRFDARHNNEVFELVVGGEFTDLSLKQEAAIYNLISLLKYENSQAT